MGSEGDQGKMERAEALQGSGLREKCWLVQVWGLSEEKGTALLLGVVLRIKCSSFFPTHQLCALFRPGPV